MKYLAVLLGALSLFVSAWLFTTLASQQDSINESRVNITYQSCREQNRRHDRTIAKIDALIAQIHDPARRRRAEANVDGTKALIQALAPRQDCDVLVRHRFGPDVHPK